MTEKTIQEQLTALREATKEATRSKEAANRYLVMAGIEKGKKGKNDTQTKTKK